MKKTQYGAVLSLFGVLALALAGCGGETATATPVPAPTATTAVAAPTDSTPTAPPAASGAEVKVGVAFVTSGDNAIYGNSQRPAVELAFAEINAAGGANGHPLTGV